MKLKESIKIMLVTCGLVALAACSSMHKHDNGPADVADASGGGAQTSGAGEGDNFADTSNLSPEQLLARRTYYFEYDKSEVRDAEKAAIFANADNLVAHPRAKVLLEGHTDPRGSREYNIALGERRAKAVEDLLKSKGVNPSQIRVISYGAERLAVPGHEEGDYQRDRRVVLVYLQH